MALDQYVANKRGDIFTPDLIRDCLVNTATEWNLRLRAGRRDDARQQGYDGKHWNPFAKICHFLLLVNFKIELMKVLFQPEPQNPLNNRTSPLPPVEMFLISQF